MVGPRVRPEARGEGLVRPRGGTHRGGHRAPLDSEDTATRSALSDVLMKRGDGSFGMVDRGGDCRGVTDEHIVVLTVLRVRQAGGVGPASAFAAWRPRSKSRKEMHSTSLLSVLLMESHRCAQCFICGGDAARVE